jgi:hypothetical protein
VSPTQLETWLVLAEAFVDGLTRRHPALLDVLESDDQRCLVLHSVGRALGRALAEAYGRDGGLVLASVFFDGLMDRWAAEP